MKPIVDYLDSLSHNYAQLCQRGDGTIYGIASGKQCRKGKPVPSIPSEIKSKVKSALISKLKSKSESNSISEDKVTGFRVPPSSKGYDIQKDIDNPSKKFLGRGAFGAVSEFSDPPPRVLKDGIIGLHEAEALWKLRNSGIAPEFYGVSLKKVSIYGDSATGYISMSKVEGVTLKKFLSSESDPDKRSEVERNLISARAIMHKSQISHGDFHSGNVIVKNDGTVSIIDFGFSDIGYEVAFSEAEDVGDLLTYIYNSNTGFNRNSAIFSLYRENLKKAHDFIDSVESDIDREELYRQALDVLYEGF